MRSNDYLFFFFFIVLSSYFFTGHRKNRMFRAIRTPLSDGLTFPWRPLSPADSHTGHCAVIIVPDQIYRHLLLGAKRTRYTAKGLSTQWDDFPRTRTLSIDSRARWPFPTPPLCSGNPFPSAGSTQCYNIRDRVTHTSITGFTVVVIMFYKPIFTFFFVLRASQLVSSELH